MYFQCVVKLSITREYLNNKNDKAIHFRTQKLELLIYINNNIHIIFIWQQLEPMNNIKHNVFGLLFKFYNIIQII